MGGVRTHGHEHVGFDNPAASADGLDDAPLPASVPRSRTAWQTTIKVLTTGVLAALLVGVAIKLRLMGGPQ